METIELKPIKTDIQYEKALSDVYDLMQEDFELNSANADKLEVLSILIKEYENKHYTLPKPNPIEAINFRLEQMNLPSSELTKILGFPSRKSEILSGKRKLNLSMIRRLNKELRIPANVLIQEY